MLIKYLFFFRSRLSILPDKGKKIQDLYDRVCKELEARNQIDKAAELFSELNIASIGKKQLNKLEWSGKYDPAKDSDQIYLDSDDEEEVDPLKIIASSMKSQNKKVVKIEKEESLITESDVKEIESFKIEPVEIENAELKDKSKLEKLIGSSQNNKLEDWHKTSEDLLEPHAVYLCEKSQHASSTKEKFLPFKTTKSNVHDPKKEKDRKMGKHWENTSATPPLIQHTGIQMLSLQESIEAEKNQREKLQELMEKQAQDRLAMKLQRQMNGERSEPTKIPPDANSNLYFANYRDILEEDVSDKESDISNDSETEK